MADDDEVRGAPGVGDIFGPTGPRRSSFTPAPTDAESLEAVANVFDDDEIAAAMSAEFARVASGPIPIQRIAAVQPEWPLDAFGEAEPVAEQPLAEQPVAVASAPVATQPEEPEPVAIAHADPEPVASEPVASVPVASVPVASAPVEPEPVEPAPLEPAPEPEPVVSAPAEPEVVVSAPLEPEVVAPEPGALNIPAPEPVAPALSTEPAPAPYAPPAIAPTPAPADDNPWLSVPAPAPDTSVAEDATPAATLPGESEPPAWGTPEAFLAPAPVAEPVAAVEPESPPTAEPVTEIPAEPSASGSPAAVPQGPPDWATPLFGPPSDSEATTAEESAAAEEQPAAAQQVAPSDPFAPSAPSFAPSNGPFPPPGDSPPEPTPSPFGPPSPYAQPLASDPDALRALYSAAPAPTVPASDAPPPPGYTFDPLAAEQAEPPSAPEPAGSETLSAIEELQAHLDKVDRESHEYPAWAPAPPTEEPAAYLPPPAEEPAENLAPPANDFASFLAPPVEERAGFVAPPVEEPIASTAPPVEEPVAYTPPAEEPAVFAAPPVEPVAFAAPPVAEPVAFAAPAVGEPVAYTQPPAEEPAAFVSPPAAETPQPYDPPPVQEPFAFGLQPAPEPIADEPAPAVEPPSSVPPVDEPVSFEAPADEAASPAAPDPEYPAFAAPRAPEQSPFFTPIVDEPAAYVPPPVTAEQSIFAPPAPVEEPVAYLPPPTVEPAAAEIPIEQPFSSFAPPTGETAGIPALPEDDPFDIFGTAIDRSAGPTPVGDASPFPGFASPTSESPIDFAAPADPRELAFDPAPPADAPVFLAPAMPPAPEAYTQAPVTSAPDSNGSVVHELPVLVEPPAPDGVADLWRAASQEPVVSPDAPTTAFAWPEQSAPVPQYVAPSPEPQAAPPAPEPPASSEQTFAVPSWDAPAAEPAAVAPPAAFEPPPAPSVSEAPHGFDDLLTGSAVDPGPQPPSQPPPSSEPPGAEWVAADPDPSAEPDVDAATGERRPFGEGVERDEAVDPSDSIFGAQRAPVTVDYAGVAVVPDYIVVESQPISVIGSNLPLEEEALVAPPINTAEKVGLEPTPQEQRVGRSARLFWLWFAANSSIAAVVFGAIIFALGVSLRQAIVATLAGVALSFIPLGLGTLAGKRSGQPTMVISRATFGVVGNILPALISLFSRLFWAAALLWVLGAGTSNILVGAHLTDGFTGSELTLAAMAIGFVFALVIAYGGYGLISIAQLVVSIISGIAILGFIVLTFRYVKFSTALSTPDGPWILVVTGAVLVFSFVGLAWANSSADLARYQRPGSSGAASMLWATFGAALPSFVLIAYGALLAASNSRLAAAMAVDPLDSLGRLLPAWYPVPLLAATVLSLLSGVVLAIYSGGFALQSAGLRLRRPLSTLLVGLLVLVIAVLVALSITDFSQLFRDFSTTVAVPVAAWAGIFGSEIMIRSRRFDSQSLLERGGVYADVRWGNLSALVVISLIGFGFLSATIPGLAWEGYLYSALGVPLTSQLATSDLGVLVALVLGLVVPLAFGIPAIRRQEKAVRVPE
jgi:purine-cytosine permease-like protein